MIAFITTSTYLFVVKNNSYEVYFYLIISIQTQHSFPNLMRPYILTSSFVFCSAYWQGHLAHGASGLPLEIDPTASRQIRQTRVDKRLAQRNPIIGHDALLTEEPPALPHLCPFYPGLRLSSTSRTIPSMA